MVRLRNDGVHIKNSLPMTVVGHDQRPRGRRLNLRLAATVAVLLSVSGCSGGGAMPTTPTTTSAVVSPAGSWSGAIIDGISGDGTMHLTLSEQAPNSLTGTWSATFKNGDSFLGPAVAGLFTPTGYGINLSVDPPPPCAGPGASAPLGFILINVVVTSNRLTAVAGRTSCNGLSFGTISLSRQ